MNSFSFTLSDLVCMNNVQCLKYLLLFIFIQLCIQELSLIAVGDIIVCIRKYEELFIDFFFKECNLYYQAITVEI